MGITSTKTSVNPLYSARPKYSTGWVVCNDWTNQHLGDTVGSNVNHGLDAVLENLHVKVFISSDGTDANSQEIQGWVFSTSAYGFEIYPVDNNNIQIQTGNGGIDYISASGVPALVPNGWYYKIVVINKDDIVPIATNVMETYETGWVYCTDWTNQHLGDTVGGDVVHNLNCDLSELIVKVLISTDGSDGNSLEFNLSHADGVTVFRLGTTVMQVDNNTIRVQTGAEGIGNFNDADGSVNVINTETWYYKVKVIKLATQYKAPQVQRYSTGWVVCNDWTDTGLGDSPGGNVTHNFNTPLSDLDIKVLVSSDGTDANAIETYNGQTDGAPGTGQNTGYSFYQVSTNEVYVQTGANGICRMSGAGILTIIPNGWYYQIVVTKRYNTLTATVAPVMPSYDTGWVNCSDWTDQHLGDTVGSNVNHALGYNLRELLVQVFISTDGTDNNSFQIDHSTGGTASAAEIRGINIYQVDTNNITVQTGANGIRQILDAAGATNAIDTENWYYRVIVTKIQPVISVRNISDDYETSEIDTGAQWIDNKTIYRKVVDLQGQFPNNNTTTTAHGITTVDTWVNFEVLGVYTTGETAKFFLYPAVNGAELRVSVTSTDVRLQSTGNWTSWDNAGSHAILEYTKV